MRRLYADGEEKRVTRGSDISGQDGEQEQLDVNDPNQRSLLGPTLVDILRLELSRDLGAKPISRPRASRPFHPE